MCGIAGIVGTSTIHRASRMRAMKNALVHRGPDSEGEMIDPHAAIGIRRLRVIDLLTGDQPQTNEERTIWIVFNGEIYNFQELRAELLGKGHRFRSDSDTEVIVHLYEECGADLLSRLRGMFAFGLWDQRKNELLLARDPLGKKPLLYWTDGEEIAFASEHEALLLGLPGDPEISLAAIRRFLGLGYIPGPEDGIAGVKKLLPGHLLRWRDGKVEIRRYWRPPVAGTLRIAEQDAIHELRRLLRSAVARRLIADVPVGAFLSGGVDSGAVVATMSELSHEVRTFTIGFEDRSFSELHLARKVAERFGTTHREVIVRPLDADLLPLLVRHYGEPYADSSALPTFQLSKLAREHVTVALNGDGGDELFAGYDRYVALRFADVLERLPLGLGRLSLRAISALPSGASERSIVARTRRFALGARRPHPERYRSWISLFDEPTLGALLTDDFEIATRTTARFDDGEIDWHHDPVSAAQLFDQMSYLPFDLLVKVDIASMADSLEVRSPLLDLDMVEFAITLPMDLKLRGFDRKFLLRKAMRGSLPDEVLDGPKRGFGVPLAAWFRGELKGMLFDTILSERALARGYFRPAVLRSLVEAHQAGRADHGHRLWALLMLELWHREVIERPRGARGMVPSGEGRSQQAVAAAGPALSARPARPLEN